MWDEKRGGCLVEKILGTKERIRPLNLLIEVWDWMRKHKNIESDILYYKYKMILIYYYRKHPEEIEYDD